MIVNKQNLTLAICLTFIGCAARESALSQPDARPISKPAPASLSAEPDDESLPALTDASTLQDYLAFAALHNPGLKAAFQRWKAALEQVAQAEALPDPRFNYKYFIREIETRTGPHRESFSVTQTFPWFGKLALREDVAARQAKQQQHRYDLAKRKLFFNVKSTYYEYYYLGRALAITEENLLLLKTLEEVARTRYQSGEATHSAVIKFQIEVAKLDDRLHSLGEMKTPVLARLNAALNHPSEADLPWPRTIETEKRPPDETDIETILGSDSPELLELAQLIEKEKATVKLARRQSYPDVTLGAGYIDTRDAATNVSGSGEDPVSVTLSVNVPLWQDKNRAVENQARAGHMAAVHDYQEQLNRLQVQWKNSVYRYDDAWRKITLYDQSLIPKARQALSVTQQDYATAAIDFFDMIDAIRTLLEFELTLERARTDQGTALAELELIAGNT